MSSSTGHRWITPAPPVEGRAQPVEHLAAVLAQAVVVMLGVDDEKDPGHLRGRGARQLLGDVHVLGVDAGRDRDLVALQGIQVVQRTLHSLDARRSAVSASPSKPAQRSTVER